MKELVPFCAGLLAGGGLALLRSARLRTLLLPVLAVGLGAGAAWVNGELGSRWWALFLSFDALVVWLGAVAGLVLVTQRARIGSVRERRAP